jgi:hypothetical protein
MFHGYGGSKIGLSDMHRWLDQGYATFSMTDRGFHESCGSTASQTAGGAECNDGYVRLIDNRYEVRDAQYFAGLLADQGVGLIAPKQIGAIGGSYGGGMSMALGALKNRVVNLDYSLSPWTSPAGKPMEIAAAAPDIPWTDLAYSLVPNGSTLDYVADAPYQGRIGVQKQSLVSGLYLSGLTAPGFYAPTGTDSTADLVAWQAALNAGEPYGASTQSILDEITAHHSSYYIDHSIPPAPMLMSSGFTDDLFPADETIRYYNRTKTEYPDSNLALFFGDFGHPRAQNKSDATNALRERENAWFNYYIKGVGSSPQQGVEAFTETCAPTGTTASQYDPSAGPYSADSWATIAPGEIRLDSKKKQTIAPDSTTGGAFNPVTSKACATTASTDTPGAAIYKLDPAPAGGFTLMGAVSVIAKFTLPGDTSQVAARMVDVAPDGQETLVDRGLWRPATGGPTKQVFQLHPNGYQFAEGHVAKLELIAADSTTDSTSALGNYGRPSNNQQPVTVSDLEMRLPVIEKPGSLDGLVGAPAEKFLPKGYALAADFASLPHPKAKLKSKKLKLKGKKVLDKVACPAAFVACHDGKVLLTAAIESKGKGGNAFAKKRAIKVASGKFGAINGGKTKTVKLKLTGAGRKLLARKPKLKVFTSLSIAESAEPTTGKAKIVGAKKKR